MSLMSESDEGTTHRDDVVVRMWREDEHGLRIRKGRNGTSRIVCIRLSSRPSCDSMLQIVEYLDVYGVISAARLDESAK